MKERIESPHDNTPRGSDHGEVNNEPVSRMNKIRARFAFVTIEPFLLCYILPSYLSNISVEHSVKLKLEKACRTDFNSTEEKCFNDPKLLKNSESLVAELTKLQVPLQNAIPAITILFIAAWSDRTGNRKALMLLPMLGELISHTGLFLTTYFFDEWSLFVTGLIEVLPTVLSGGYYVAFMGAFCYLADVTSLETRTFRFGIVGAVMGLCPPIAMFIRKQTEIPAGYYGSYGISISLYGLGLLYTYFMIHDMKPIKIEAPWHRKLLSFVDPSNAWSSLSIAFKSGPDRGKILLVIAARVIISGPANGLGGILYRYLSDSSNMGHAEIIKYYYCNAVLMGECSLLMAVTLFSKYLKIHDAILGIIVTVAVTASIVISSSMYALTSSTLWLYSGPILALIGGTEIWRTLIRSLWTKTVAPGNIAKLYSLFGIVEAMIPLVYAPIFDKLYNYTKDGKVSLLAAAMTAPSILIFLAIYKIMKKEETRVTDTQSKELPIHAYNNDITSL